jgi:hypothetical protein
VARAQRIISAVPILVDYLDERFQDKRDELQADGW